MTLKQIRDDVLGRFGTDHEVSNAQIDNFINEGYSYIIAKLVDTFEDVFGDTEEIALEIGINEYTPTKEFLSIKRIDVDFNNGQGFRRAAFTDMDSLRDSTNFLNPHYYFWGSKIGIAETPTGSGTLKIRGIATPARLAVDNESPAIASPFHQLLTTWAVGCMLEAVEEDYTSGARKKAEFEAKCEEMIIITKDKMADGNKFIKSTPLV